MVLDVLGVYYNLGEAFESFGMDLFRKIPEGKLAKSRSITMDVVYPAVETAGFAIDDKAYLAEVFLGGLGTEAPFIESRTNRGRSSIRRKRRGSL